MFGRFELKFEGRIIKLKARIKSLRLVTQCMDQHASYADGLSRMDNAVTEIGEQRCGRIATS